MNWESYNLAAIWDLVAGEDTCAGSDRVLGWAGLATAVRDQHRRLLAARDRLAEVWPPETNDSAQKFIDQINGLADSMQQTLARAEDTKAGLQGVLDAVGRAQSRLNELAAGQRAVSDDWMPRWIDHAEDAYDVRAQQVMRQAEAEVSDHSARIQAPDLFEMRPAKLDNGVRLAGKDDLSGSLETGSSGATLRAVPRPVASVVTAPHIRAHDLSGTSRAATTPPGPVLTGITRAPAGGTGPFVSQNGSLGQGASASLDPARPDGINATTLPVGGLRVPDPGAMSRPLGVVGERQVAPAVRTMPPGAVIGGQAGSAGVAGTIPAGGTGGGRRGERPHKGATKLIADQVWQIDEGVPPVIQPHSGRVWHKPGPGVIGIDR